jgi:hypothetical protein
MSSLSKKFHSSQRIHAGVSVHTSIQGWEALNEQEWIIQVCGTHQRYGLTPLLLCSAISQRIQLGIWACFATEKHRLNVMRCRLLWEALQYHKPAKMMSTVYVTPMQKFKTGQVRRWWHKRMMSMFVYVHILS